jgi:DNA repair exonuclease SbcCD ATPase subunit
MTCNENGSDDFRRSSEFKKETYNQLKEMSRELSKVRKQNQTFREQQNNIPQLIQRIHILEASLSQQQNQRQQTNLPVSSVESGVEFTADITAANLMEQIEALTLQLSEAENRERSIRQELMIVRGNSGSIENKCKKIIAMCCNIQLDLVDEFVQPLLDAMSSDDSELNVEQVAEFMNQHQPTI